MLPPRTRQKTTGGSKLLESDAASILGVQPERLFLVLLLLENPSYVGVFGRNADLELAHDGRRRAVWRFAELSQAKSAN